ncbi:MAG TPA: VWA domain-containing protein [Thermoanaerobaculia bacterium]
MTRLRPLLCWLSLTGLGASALPAQAPERTGFGESVDVNVVNVEVYVTDARGNPVTGLRKGDFDLLVDGRRAGISNFDRVERGARRGEAGDGGAAPEDAWNLIVFVDNFNIHPANRARVLRQLRDVLGRTLAPGDRVMLASYDMGLKVRLPFTSDSAALAKALDDLEGLPAHALTADSDRQRAYRAILTIQGASLSDPLEPLPCPPSIAQPAHDFAAARKDEALRTLGGLQVLVNSLSGLPGRKAVLHVSDGIPATPGAEVFQFLAEICGGGSGTGGIGRQIPVGNDKPEDERTGPLLPDPASPDGEKVPFRQPSQSPDMVYDPRSLGPRAYQGASQAPLDAQGYHIGKEIDGLVAHANAQQVTLYTLQAVGAERPAAADADPGDRITHFQSIDLTLRKSYQDSLTALADGTGGRAILGVNDISPALARMREDASFYYLLGFEPGSRGEGGEHSIEVRARNKSLRVRHRQSYRDKSVMEKTVDRTLASLYYGADENPLQIGLEIGQQTPGPNGAVSVPVQLRIPVYKLAILEKKDEGIEARLRLLLATRDGEGRTSQVRQVPLHIQVPVKEVLHAMGQFYVYTLTVHLQPGDHRVAVAVRDELSATTSFLSRGFTVNGV